MTRIFLGVTVVSLLITLAGCGGGEGASSTAETEQDQTSQSSGDNNSETTSNSDLSEIVASGQQLATSRGCLACHSIDGSQSVGPTWAGLYGASRTLTDGSTVVADDEYLKESLLNPASKIVEGFQNLMPATAFNDDDTAALIAYIESLKE